MNLEDFRREYLAGGLTHPELNESPFEQFEHWMNQALEVGIKDPTAMVLATVSDSGQPSQRIVLLKGFDENGFVFYTNYGSNKALEMSINLKVCVLFPWHQLDRQIKIEGRVEKVPIEQSAKYFATRPRESQLAAWASDQSQVIPSRAALMEELEKLEAQFEGKDVPLPENWGGYRIIPVEFEFWQGGAHRLHDRFTYTLEDGSWVIRRLAP